MQQIRRVDQIAVNEFGMLSLVLMENAGRGCADFISSEIFPDRRIVVLCGGGNNGGDGLVIARHLHAMHHEVVVWMIADRSKLSADCQANLAILERTRVRVQWCGPEISPAEIENRLAEMKVVCSQCQVIVDALLGTGATGQPRSPMSQAISIANEAQATRIAIDIPSGLDATSGVASEPTFQAHHTLTFVAMKPGFTNLDAIRWLGELRVLSIGVPPEIIVSVTM